MRRASPPASGAFLQRHFVVVYDSVVRFWPPPTPLLSIAPLRYCWFAVGALAPREDCLQQRGLLFVRIGFSWLKCLSTASQCQWSPTPLCGLLHGVIRRFVRHRLAGHRSSCLKCLSLSLWSSVAYCAVSYALRLTAIARLVLDASFLHCTRTSPRF